jgi:hypothetical protein
MAVPDRATDERRSVGLRQRADLGADLGLELDRAGTVGARRRAGRDLGPQAGDLALGRGPGGVDLRSASSMRL